MTIDCCIVWKFVKKMIRVIWTFFWLILIAASPMIWSYIANNGPDWYIESGWQWDKDTQSYFHVPSILSLLLFDVLFVICAVWANAD
jgi:glucan phosphoethanolaminetransferase (alkaline phosphatase superfamily)